MKNQESTRKEAPMRGHEENLMQQQVQPSAKLEGETSAARTQHHEYSQVATNAPAQIASAPVNAAPSSCANAPIQRVGEPIPGGAKMENFDVDDEAILTYVAEVAKAADPIWASNVNWRRRVGTQVVQAIKLMGAQGSIPIDFIEDTGINMHWTGSITFRMDNKKPATSGGGTGTVASSSGGSGSLTTTTATGQTDGATASGTVTNAPPGATGGTTVGGTAGVNTSSTRTDTNGTTMTANAGGAATSSNNLERFEADVTVLVDLTSEADISGSDYINPAKWGMALGDAITLHHAKGTSGKVGTMQYFRSNGIAGSAPPAQRKSWLEHELGITEESTRNAERMQELNALDPASFSRSGAQPLPGGVTRAAQMQYGASLGDVNLIHGGEADSYAQQMDAAAFTTPNAQGGSDIFVRGSVDLDSAAGQHTLQHEIAHAAQNKNGQTDQLSGLGGDPFQRHTLERDADQKADGVMKSMTQNAPTAAEAKPAQGA